MGWAGIKQGQYPDFESHYKEDARAYNNIADDHERTAKVVLETYKSLENQATPALEKANPGAFLGLQNEMDKLRGNNPKYFTEPEARAAGRPGFDYRNPYEKGEGRSKSHRWDLEDLYQPADKPDEPAP